MTGPEHYAEAERLLRTVRELAIANANAATLAALHAEAQVHATLALAAATLEAADTTARAVYKGQEAYTPAAVNEAWDNVVWPT